MGLFSEMGHGLKAIFGDDPSQYVEPSDWEDFKTNAAVAAKKGIISKDEAAVLMKSFKTSFIEKARKFAERIEATISLTPSDRVNAKAPEVEPASVKIPEKQQRTRDGDRFIGE